MKSLVVFCTITATLLASSPAAAQQNPGSPRIGQGGPERQVPPQRVPARDATMKSQNREANRNAHMTPEQRQQLRRDVHDHGRDIYRDRRDPGRRR